VVILLSHVARGVLVGAVAGVILTGAIQLWQLYVLAACFGAIDAMFYPASQAIVPSLVDEDRLASSNALLQGSEEASGFAGPALAGILIALVGTTRGSGVAFAVDAGTFVFAALAIWSLPIGRGRDRRGEDEPDGAAGAGELLGNIAEGLRYAWSDPALRAVLVLATVMNLAFVGPMEVGLATLARTRFLGSAAAFGMMFSGWGVGALLGSLLGGIVTRPPHRGLVMLALAGLQGFGLVLLAVVPSVGLAIIVIGSMGLGVGFFNVLIFSWFQIRTEPQMLGRVMSLAMFAAFGMGPVSYAFAGVIASLGAASLFSSAGFFLLGGTVLAATSQTLRGIE
jgi:MFS family permease